MIKFTGKIAAAATLALAALPMFAIASNAYAAPAAVQVADLDLSTPQGAAVLDQRIDAAARRFCRGVETTGTRLERADCIQAVRAEVAEKLAARRVQQAQAASFPVASR